MARASARASASVDVGRIRPIALNRSSIAIGRDHPIERERFPELGAGWEDEIVAHHADDRVLHAVELHRSPDDPGIAAEPPDP
jgi:hypothetical protein